MSDNLLVNAMRDIAAQFNQPRSASSPKLLYPAVATLAHPETSPTYLEHVATVLLVTVRADVSERPGCMRGPTGAGTNGVSQTRDAVNSLFISLAPPNDIAFAHALRTARASDAAILDQNDDGSSKPALMHVIFASRRLALIPAGAQWRDVTFVRI